MSSTHILRAFLWMRWRVFVNSLERTGARDTLERFSIATEKLGPIVAFVLLIPSSIGLLVLGLTAGFGVATGAWLIAIEVVRYLLLVALALSLVGPIIMPSRDSSAVVRLLLLPIPRLGLYLGQAAGALADPWILLTVPLVAGVAIGLAIGLKFAAALIALAAGVGFLMFLTGLTSLTASVVHLLLRDRRRGELVMFLVVVLIPIVTMGPQLLLRSERHSRKLTRAERAALPPSRLEQFVVRMAPYAPSEMYRRAAIAAAASPLDAAVPLGSLALIAAAVQAAGFGVYRRVLDMPVSLGTRRAGAFGGLWNRVVPGLTPGASAVALTQLRLGLRTPRGRASMVTPLLMCLVFGAVIYRGVGVPIPGLDTRNGIGLAVVGLIVSILALLPLAMNQFAIDKAGFTRQMLLPLSVRELLWGKAVGNAMIAAVPSVCCLVISVVIFPTGRPDQWAALLIAAASTYVLLAPAAAALSALFPKTVDLNSIGNSGNAHQAAGLLGMLSFAASAAPSVLLTLFALRIIHRPEFLPLLLLTWLIAAAGLSYILFIPVARFVASRRETLAQYY